MTRTLRWAAVAILIATILGGPLAGLARAQDSAATEQLDATAAAMSALQSFSFDLETTAGKTSFQNALELKSVTGDVVRPSSFRAKVEVKLLVVSMTLEVIGIDGEIWLKSPLGGDNVYVQVTGGDANDQLPPPIFLNPDQLIGQALGYLDNPQLEGTEELDGQTMTVLTGTFDPKSVIGSGTPLPNSGDLAPASTPLDVKAWIDDQDRLVRVDFTGPLFDFEEGSGRLVRTITLSNFDEVITIERPA